ncbi:MAG: cyanophycin synthetase [Candidatus Thermoplasmatota archaeon]|nr:cyanophycin synthetase [Candidatus Thermoplasmatota archaeon]
MEILEIRALRGPNYYSRYPTVFMELDIGDLEETPTDKVPGFRKRIEEAIPSLREHRCSVGTEGGFFKRIEDGTWAGHVVEHVSIELQCLARTEVGFGKTFDTKRKGIYHVVFRYRDEQVGIEAGRAAVRIVESLFKGEDVDIRKVVYELKEIREKNLYGPSTQSIVDEAKKRDIPVIRLNDESYVQLGYGVHQRRIQATMMDNTSSIGVEIADDKERAKEMLDRMGIPVPKGYSAWELDEACRIADRIGYPVVVKPLSGNHGKGITTDIRTREELEIAYEVARKYNRTVLIERFIAGFDFRILVIDGKFTAAALREPAYVVGDGTSTIRELIEAINSDPARGFGHEKNLTRIKIDYMTERLLKFKQMTLETVLREGEKVYIKSTANLSAGGKAIDVTDDVHPVNRAMAERISKIVGLNVMGIDMIANDLSQPICEGCGAVIEVNAAPGFRMHLSPSEGKPRNVSAKVLDMLFPPGKEFKVPIIAVTGTNGKTTTVRLISHILELNGARVGMTSTDAVVVNNDPILVGDYSGPGGAKVVLMDSTIDHAVLEVARGGILRRGLGFYESDVGVLLNVTSDHLGEGGIDTLEDLANLKGIVVETVKETGYSVLNADDPIVLKLRDKAGGMPILFSLDPENPALKENLNKGSMNVTVKDETIIIQKGGWTSNVAKVVEVPITLGGKATFNILNAMAAAAAASALGLNEKQIRAGLVSFSPSLGLSPGRMNIIEVRDFKAIIDFGHNMGAIKATGELLPHLAPGRRIRMAAGTGNRRDEDIKEYGLTLSRYYDHVVIADTDPRGRPLGEVAGLVKQGLVEGGLKEEDISMVFDGREATRYALDMARKGDVVVLQADNVQQVIQDVLDYKEDSLREYTSRKREMQSIDPSNED